MGHWYRSDNGQSQYTVIGANGKERDTTLRDARKLNLVPSVTTVIAGADKPALVMYRERQILDACIARPYDFSDDEKEYRKYIANESRLHSTKAAKRGTEIHDALEKLYLGNEVDLTKDTFNIVNAVAGLIGREFQGVKWTPERSFSHPLGFGGKVDMSADGIILDFKTKDTDDIDKMVMYDEHGMQTAAYSVGLQGADFPGEWPIKNYKRYDLFISTQIPGLLKLEESTDFLRDWGMFKSLLDFWQLKNKYAPELGL